MSENKTTISLYVVKTTNGTYFAGFDTAKQQASFVENPIEAKIFTNKYDIKLRPEETLVELSIDLSKADVQISEPFRPQHRVPRQK